MAAGQQLLCAITSSCGESSEACQAPEEGTELLLIVHVFLSSRLLLLLLLFLAFGELLHGGVGAGAPRVVRRPQATAAAAAAGRVGDVRVVGGEIALVAGAAAATALVVKMKMKMKMLLLLLLLLIGEQHRGVRDRRRSGAVSEVRRRIGAL
ncbi:hypothetical protein EYF80_051113 [Liparis tanakae]|uniref:Uncharacterized protein n=1 Tax=Liparis tanakae TaxID=230148 RepID=A0A4Z2FE84_9TELE|nr:hypothetical protein EYF80_051113 [Liparis tanakae]